MQKGYNLVSGYIVESVLYFNLSCVDNSINPARIYEMYGPSRTEKRLREFRLPELSPPLKAWVAGACVVAGE